MDPTPGRIPTGPRALPFRRLLALPLLALSAFVPGARATTLEQVIPSPFENPPGVGGSGVAVSATTMLSGNRVLVKAGDFWVRQAVLVPQTTETLLGTGNAVALDGDVAVIGCPGDANTRGFAFVFARSGGVWTQQAALSAQGGHIGDLFGGSVAVSGTTVAVGCRALNSGAGASSGAVFVFTRSGTTWSQQARLVAGDSAAGDNFGGAVALLGDTLLAGAPYKASRAGAAYVFVRNSGTWSQQAKLVAGDPAASDQFGGAVALETDTAAIGAPQKSISTTYQRSGAGYLFARSGTTWSQQKKVTAFGNSDYSFGISVALSGDYAFFGAAGLQILINPGGYYTRLGALHFVRRVAGTWGSVETRSSPYTNSNEGWFGATIGADAGLLAVGGGREAAGATHFFDAQGGNWPSTATRINPVDGAAGFSGPIAISGDRAAALAGSGGVQLFERDGGVWQPEVQIRREAPPDMHSEATFSHGPVTLDGDLMVLQTAISRQWSDFGGTYYTVSGTLHTYQRESDGWRHRSDLAIGSNVSRMALSGQTLIAGRIVYIWNGTSWVQQATLTPPGGASSQFGTSVAASGERVLVGAPDVQKAYLFERSGTTWTSVAEFDCPGMDTGSALALGEDAVYIGASANNTFGTGAGCVYVSLREGTGWGKLARLGVPGSGALGGKLATDGRWLAVGSATQTFLFARPGGKWRQPQQLARANGMAIHGRTLLAAQQSDLSIHAYRVSSGAVIDVLGNGQQIAPGESRASTAAQTWFGAPATAGGEVLRTFSIQNPGDAALWP
jgi:hypothetical protein